MLSAGSNPKSAILGKNALYCALHNEQAYEILDAWLATDEGKNLDAEFNWYVDEYGQRYSATKYIQSELWQGQAGERNGLLDLLRKKGCIDRFFVLVGKQPEGWINPPDHIAAREASKRQAKAEQEFELELERNRNRAMLRLEEERHAVSVRQEEERHRQQMAQERAIAVERRTIMDNEHKANMDQERAMANARRTIMDKEHKADVERESAMVFARRAILDKEHKANEEQEKRMIRLRHDATERTLQLERKMHRESEQKAERQHRRQTKLIEARNESDRQKSQRRIAKMSAWQAMLASAASFSATNQRLLEGSGGVGRAWTIRGSDSD